ncbi:hypothetical protein B0H11DRAFT_1944228 [Mycena galericulata]|nr:hypothetical protein B0H11DRAFT_1944228 [Mycena galericulata]
MVSPRRCCLSSPFSVPCPVTTSTTLSLVRRWKNPSGFAVVAGAERAYGLPQVGPAAAGRRPRAARETLLRIGTASTSSASSTPPPPSCWRKGMPCPMAGQGEPAAHVCLDGIIRKMAIQTVFPLLIAIDDFQTLAGRSWASRVCFPTPPCPTRDSNPICGGLLVSTFHTRIHWLAPPARRTPLPAAAVRIYPYALPAAAEHVSASTSASAAPTWRSTSSAARAPEERCPQKSDLDYVKRPENARVAPLPPRARQSRRVLHTKGACSDSKRRLQTAPESACAEIAAAARAEFSRTPGGYTPDVVLGVAVARRLHARDETRRIPPLRLRRHGRGGAVCPACGDACLGARGKSPPQCWNRDRPVPALHIYLRTVMPAGPPIPGVTRKLVVESGPMELALNCLVQDLRTICGVRRFKICGPRRWSADVTEITDLRMISGARRLPADKKIILNIPAIYGARRWPEYMTQIIDFRPISGVSAGPADHRLPPVLESGKAKIPESLELATHTLPVQQHAGSVHSSLHPRQKMSPLQWSSQLVAGDVHVPPEQPTFVGPSLQSPNLSHCLRPPSDGPPPPASSSGAFEVA